MKKLLFVILAALTLLCSCQSAPQTAAPAATAPADTAAATETAGKEEPKLLLVKDDEPVCQVVIGVRAQWMTEQAANALRVAVSNKGKGQSKVSLSMDAKPLLGLTEIHVGETVGALSGKLYSMLAPDQIGYIIEDGVIAIGAGSEDNLDEACLLFRRNNLTGGTVNGQMAVPASAQVIETAKDGIPSLPQFSPSSKPVVNDCSDGFWLYTYKNADEKTWREFNAKLEADGYSVYSENQIGANHYVNYTNGSNDVHSYYLGKAGLVRVVVGPSGHLCPVEDDTPAIPGAKNEITNLALKDFGLSMVIKLKDGRFVIIDGAQQSNSKPLVDFLKANVPEGETPVVAAWFFTHAHPDHTYGFYGLRTGGLTGEVKIEKFVFNFPSVKEYQNYEPDCIGQTSNVRDTMDMFFPDAQIIKPHTGDYMIVGDIRVDFLCTQEDLIPNRINDFNDTSLVMKFTVDGQTMMVTGDMSEGDFTFVNANYDDSYLKCDIFQLPHHGGNVNADFFNTVAPEIVILPSNNAGSVESFLKNNPVHRSLYDNAAAYYTSTETATIVMPYEVDSLPAGYVYTEPED